MSAHENRVAIAIRMLEPLRFEYETLPLYEHLVRYRDEGHPVGDFLTALLSNDLVAACGHADDTNLWLLPIYVAFLYNEMPGTAWLSREAVAAWLAMHRTRRAQEASV
jgi:hypothetical protein